MAINSFEFNIGNEKTGDFTDGVAATLKGIRSVQSVAAKNSLTSMTKDLILQYPCLVDSDVETENAMIVVKAIERQYAALQLALWSADTAFGVDTTTANGTRDFIKRYHSNSDEPDKITYVGNLIRNINQFRANEAAISEDAEIIGVKDSDKTVSKAALESACDTLEDALNMKSLNQMYIPTTNYVNTVNQIAKATEAKTIAERVNAMRESGPVVQQFDPSSYDLEENKAKRSLPNASLVKNDKQFAAAEPTMLEIQFFVRDGVNGSRVQSAIIGVKAMGHSIETTAMRTNLIKSLQSVTGAFQFVKWTRGETKLVKDYLFNVSSIKEDAINRGKFDRWFSSLRKRKRNFKAYKGGNVTINPTTTIIISSATAQAIKSTAGFDLMDPKIAQQLMNSLFLLGFVIVDQSTGVVYTLFDDFDGFMETTLSAMKVGKSGDVDYSSFKDMLKLMGRL